MSAGHSAALDHALAEALSRTAEPYADELGFRGRRFDDEGKPAQCYVIGWRDNVHYSAYAATPGEALAEVMRQIAYAQGVTT